jgi:hypothetical protein
MPKTVVGRAKRSLRKCSAFDQATTTRTTAWPNSLGRRSIRRRAEGTPDGKGPPQRNATETLERLHTQILSQRPDRSISLDEN